MSARRVPRDRGQRVDWEEIRCRVERSREAVESLLDTGRDRQDQILSERAIMLARATSAPREAAAFDDWLEVLVFQSAGERYAFETAHVAQVHRILPITPVPGLPDFIVGVVVIQGEVLSVIDLRSLLNLPISTLAEPTAIIVLRSETMEFGILAETVSGIERYASAALEHGLATLANIEKTYLKGVARDRTGILDANQLLSDPEMVFADSQKERRKSKWA